MRVKDFYLKYSDSYDAVLNRLKDESRILKYLKLFIIDDSHKNLCEAIDNKDVKNAFMFSHNLKGVCANLGIDSLYKLSSEICEIFRSGNFNDEAINLKKEIDELYKNICVDIKQIEL